MGRKKRIHYPGIIFHAMDRGNHGDPIFRDQRDYDHFLELLAEAKTVIPFQLYAYALMPNHWHLLIKAGLVPISRVLHRVQSKYAKWFNARYQLTGHLFQRRYHAIHINTDAYLLGAIRYIHLNPVKANLVSDPADWRWSGHAELQGKNQNHLLDFSMPLSIFSQDAERACERYEKFLSEMALRRGRPKLSRPQIWKVLPTAVLTK